jgi:hypothetical protein
MAGNKLELGLGCFGRLVAEKAKGMMVVRSPLHGMVDLTGRRLLQRLLGILIYLPFRLEEYGAIFCVVIGFITVEHVVHRLVGVWTSAVTTASAWCAPSLMMLV